MSDFFTVSVLVATLASGIRLATPFLLSALGETIGQRSGVLNLGVEGVMLIGAYAAYITALRTGSVVRRGDCGHRPLVRRWAWCTPSSRW